MSQEGKRCDHTCFI